MAKGPEGHHVLDSERYSGSNSNLVLHKQDIVVTVESGIASFEMPGYEFPEMELSVEAKNPYKLEYGETDDTGIVLISGKNLHEITLARGLSTASVFLEMYNDIHYVVTGSGKKTPLVPDHPYILGRYSINGDEFSIINVPGIGRENSEMALILKEFGDPNDPYVYYLLEKTNKTVGIWVDRTISHNDHVRNVHEQDFEKKASPKHLEICYDAVATDPHGKFFIVADGIDKSPRAAGVAVNIFSQNFTLLYEYLHGLTPEDRFLVAPTAVLSCLDTAMRISGQEMKRHLGGTTLLAYYLENGFLYGVHAGDSRFYQYRKKLDTLFLNTRDEIELPNLILALCDGDEFKAMPIVDAMLRAMNNADTLVDLENEWQKIFKNEKLHWDKHKQLIPYWHQRHQLTNSLSGTKNDKKTFSITPVTPGDRFLFTTDGLEAIKDETIEDILRKASNVKEAKEMILQALADAYADENSFRIYDFDIQRKRKAKHVDDVSFIVAFTKDENTMEKAWHKAKMIFS